MSKSNVIKAINCLLETQTESNLHDILVQLASNNQGPTARIVTNPKRKASENVAKRRRQKPRHYQFTYNGKTYRSISQAAKDWGINPRPVYSLMEHKKNLTVQDAFDRIVKRYTGAN